MSSEIIFPVLYAFASAMPLVAAAGDAHSNPDTVVAAAAAADTVKGAVYDGRAHETDVRIPEIDTTIAIDGTLSAPVWERAAILKGFSEYTPVDGRPAEDSTSVYVWYSSTALYFGVRAYETHGHVHATLAKRDVIEVDDHIHFILIPFIHSRQALNFAVNPLGMQADGTITEGIITSGSFGLNTTTGPPPTDLSPDFVWDSKGHLTPFGFEVVVRIPFRSIKFPSKKIQDWGFNVTRRVQHSGHSDSWYPARIEAASYLGQTGALVGFTGLSSGLVLDLNPIVTEKVIGDSGVPGPWRYGVNRPQFGGNVRWGITNNLTFTGTYRPDFAEVESDATKIIIDPRNAVSYPEKRPFFLEGLEQFSVPNNLIYTRQISAPIGAAKFTGKAGPVSLAYMGALDDEGNISAGGLGHPAFNIMRLRQDFSQGSQIGATITDKEVGGTYNRLAAIDSRITFDRIYSVFLQAATSSSRDAGVSGAGPLWQARLTRSGRAFVMDYNVTGIDPEFDAQSGFIARRGIVNAFANWRYTWYPTSPIFESYAVDVLLNPTWIYRNFTSAEAPEERRHKLNLLATLHGGWQIRFGLFAETYGYDPTLYNYYYLGHISGVDTTYTKFVGTPTIPNTDYVLTLTTPSFAKFDMSLTEVAGRDENFFEWSSADVNITQATLNYRPTSKLRAQLMYNAQIYWRHDDGSIVGKTLIPRLSLEYQLSQAIFFRVIGQYDAVYQNNLRDDARTNLPIFTDSAGTFVRAASYQSNTFAVSGLFAYQPVPGTVAFVGYGNNLTEPDGFHFSPIKRAADTFFVKFSYLFKSQ